jgi:hypothetical protein
MVVEVMEVMGVMGVMGNYQAKYHQMKYHQAKYHQTKNTKLSVVVQQYIRIVLAVMMRLVLEEHHLLMVDIPLQSGHLLPVLLQLLQKHNHV